jgi:hypothetical protein
LQRRRRMNGRSLQSRIADDLLERIKAENYPSVTMMNRVETVVGQDPEQLSAYAEVLLEKVESSRFPSIEMLNRLDRIAAQLR